MARILMVGIDPDLVDFTDPALPPGMDAEMIRRGIAAALDGLKAAGHDPHHQYIPPEAAALGDLADRLSTERFDCVVVGGGVRLPPRNLALFEAVLNVIASQPQAPAIALVAAPPEAPQAVARALALRL